MDKIFRALLLTAICGLALAWTLAAWGKLRESSSKRSEADACYDDPMDVFVGRWRLSNKDGVTSSYLNVTKAGASRDHAPGVKCKMESSPGCLRIAWDDGFCDMLALGNDGRMTFAALDDKGDVRFRLNAAQMPPRR